MAGDLGMVLNISANSLAILVCGGAKRSEYVCTLDKATAERLLHTTSLTLGYCFDTSCKARMLHGSQFMQKNHR